MKKNLLFYICMLFMLPVFSQSDTLRIDFNSTNVTTSETGWQVMGFIDKTSPSTDYNDFTAFETTVKVRPVFLNNPIAASTRAVDRNSDNYLDELDKVLDDWIAADLLVGDCNILAIQLTAIPAGKYTWKSYHHDDMDQKCRFTAKVENKEGTIYDDDSLYQISSSKDGNVTSFKDVTKFFNDSVVSAGPEDTITIYFTHEFVAGASEIGDDTKLLVLNGFELYLTPDVLPEILVVTPEELSFNGQGKKEFYVYGENLIEDISISDLSGCSINPTTFSATGDDDTVKVTFDGNAAIDGYIYITSGGAKDSVKVVGTEYVKDTLRIDFNKKNITATESGWNVIEIADKQYPSSEYSSFSALAGEVKVRPLFLNNPIAASTRAVDRNSGNYTDKLYEVLDDYIAADAIEGEAANGDHCNILAIQLTGIPAGTFAWKSYHHDMDNQYGKFTLKVENKAGVTHDDDSLYQISFSNVSLANKPGYATTFEDVSTCIINNVVSAGPEDTITISFTNEFEFDADTLNEGDQGNKFVLMNGFEFTLASSKAVLSTLAVSNGTLSPAFDEGTVTYDVVLPFGTTLETFADLLSYEAAESGKAILTNPTTLPGQGSIKVTSQDGSATETYTLNFSVKTGDDATLTSLAVDGYSLSPTFDPDTKSYSVELPAGTQVADLPAVTYTAASGASADKTDATVLPGSTTILVTAENGTDKTNYTIDFTVHTTSVSTAEIDEVRVYPTVSTSNFTVKAKEGSVIEVYDVSGTLVQTKTVTSTHEILTIDQKGLFILNITSEGKLSQFNVVIK